MTFEIENNIRKQIYNDFDLVWKMFVGSTFIDVTGEVDEKLIRKRYYASGVTETELD